MLVDSHCHLDFPELAGKLDAVVAAMKENQVTHALCISVTLQDFPQVRAIAERFEHIYGSVGVHPDYPDVPEVAGEELVRLANHPKIVAIGETGLDYFRIKEDCERQRQRFRTHIRAARRCGKPLVVHTRDAAADTLRIMREEEAGEVGGVMHCFTGDWDTAQAAMDLGFYISFSGIVTFKNARGLREVAKQVPLERMLVETDSPYLAPAPYRGKTNEPALVKYVAEEIARLRDTELAEVAAKTTENFFNLFRV
ncbi:MAG: TatD family hydrolase [Betaproteobacteria bacterium]|nr:TatD family hydrolase [Betaproteobacteria bacterium]MDH3436938.1 TatD family hydrolase [Betaproteobacteria bacterium]